MFQAETFQYPTEYTARLAVSAQEAGDSFLEHDYYYIDTLAYTHNEAKTEWGIEATIEEPYYIGDEKLEGWTPETLTFTTTEPLSEEHAELLMGTLEYVQRHGIELSLDREGDMLFMDATYTS